MPEMTIAQLAREGGVGVETVRYYQRRGMLDEPPRGAAGGRIRRYSGEDLRRLRFIRSAQTAGFTLEEIAELIRLDAGEDRLRAREMARARVAALEARIAELQAARQALSALADRCEHAPSGPCPILAAFDA